MNTRNLSIKHIVVCASLCLSSVSHSETIKSNLDLVSSSESQKPSNKMAVRSNKTSNFLENSLFDIVGSEFDIDPLLLYSITLVESGSSFKGGLSPTPLVIRFSGGAEFFKTRKEAEERLAEVLKITNNVDVGLVQRNLKWNPTRDPNRMFDALIAIRWMAGKLKETTASTQELALGIGRYHNWEDEVRARSYGKRVLKIYKNLSEHYNY